MVSDGLVGRSARRLTAARDELVGGRRIIFVGLEDLGPRLALGSFT